MYCCTPAAVLILGADTSGKSACLPLGPFAPASIQARTRLISASVGRGLSFGGILGSTSPVSMRMMRLASARVGTITSPFSPPFCNFANDASDSSPSRSVSLWQPEQYLAKIGATSLLNSGAFTSAAAQHRALSNAATETKKVNASLKAVID